RRVPTLILVNKFIVENGGGQRVTVFGFVRFPRADQAALAQNIAVFLAGYFFGHFKYKLDKGVRRKLLRAHQHHARLADVLNRALEPVAEILHTKTNRRIQLQTACSWYPRRLLAAGSTANSGRFRYRSLHTVA